MPRKKTSPRRFTSLDPELRREIRELGRTLGHVLKVQEGEGLFRDVERIRLLTKSYRYSPSSSALRKIRTFVRGLTIERAHHIVRAFHLYFLLANAADEVHRISLRASGRSKIDSPLSLAIGSLRKSVSPRIAVRRFLRDADVVPVFTAHPTEATRQTVLQKLSRLTQLLLEKRRALPSSADYHEMKKRIEAQITLLWQTTELRFNKVTVQDEILRGRYFFTEVLYDALPRLVLRLEEQLDYGNARELVSRSPVRLGTWIGGDRDGHPFVTADITRSALLEHRNAVLTKYRETIEQLYTVLSPSTRIHPVSRELTQWLKRHRRTTTLPRTAWKTEPSEIYRWAMRVIHAKIGGTIDGSGSGYRDPDELLSDLSIVATSLQRNEGQQIVDVYLRPLFYSIRAFGFSLVAMDIRDNASLVRDAVTGLIGRGRGRTGARELDHGQLSRLIVGRRMKGLRTKGNRALRTLLEELDVYKWARTNIDRKAVGSFIISNTSSASDVLGLLLVSRYAGLLQVERGKLTRSDIDVVPLFETIDDLKGSHDILRSLFQDPIYGRHLALRGGRQEIMIGYSDSSKDGGIVSSAFELFNAQIRMQEVAVEMGVDVTFFHGRGGSISRGGGPVYESILAQPRETMTGRIKITEQGEMVSAKYLVPQTALYSLEVMAAAVLYSQNSPLRSSEKRSRDAFRALFAPISDKARESYVGLTRLPEFWNYFRISTPIDIVEKIEIGSRPSSRRRRSDLSSIRAIPWVFSWTQCRQAITGWYGFGTAVGSALEEGTVTLHQLRSMYKDWPFFRALVRNIEMVLMKTDLNIAGQYLGTTAPRSHREFFNSIRAEYDRSRTAVLKIKKQHTLLENDPTLLQSLSVRNPYIDPISFIQVRFLEEFRRGRAGPAKQKKILDLLRSSINGIAAGMRNTG